MNPTKSIFLSILFIALVGFIWYAGLKPLYINRDVNMADYYARTKKCDKAVDLMQSNVIYNSSTIDSYAKLKYIGIIERCNARTPEAIELLKRVTEIRPNYTRTWIFLGNYTGDTTYFDRASELSPKREDIFVGRIRVDMTLKNYPSAQKWAVECIQTIPNSSHCWWLKAISNLYSGNIEKGFNDLKISVEKGFNYHSKRYLSQINDTCFTSESIECYEEIARIYEKIVPGYESHIEYASLLVDIYRFLNNYEKAGYWAMTTSNYAVKLKDYEIKEEMQEFLKAEIIPFYDKLIAKEPDSLERSMTLTRINMAIEDYEQAKYWAKKVLTVAIKNKYDRLEEEIRETLEDIKTKL